jgi:plastocyanin
MTVRNRLSLVVPSLIFMFLLFPGPATAEPSLGLSTQSNAHYQLFATFRSLQSCAASPSNYTFIACGPQLGLHPSTTTVNVIDDGKCLSLGCNLAPANVTINEGDTVTWHNQGSLNHTIVFDSGGFSPIFLVNASLAFKLGQPFTSSSGFQTFAISGLFGYHDSRYPSMKGTITVNALAASTPRIQDTNETGPISWAVVGLDDNAILSFHHALTTTTNSTGSTLSSANESGTFEETVNLSTREESPGLASQFRYLSPVFISNQGIGPYGGYTPVYFYQPQTLYTIWWVNGPLQTGSTVELLTSTGAVRASGAFQLSGTSWPFWTIQSYYVESYNQTQPGNQQFIPVGPNPFPIIGPGGFSQSYPEYYTAGASNNASMSLEYGQKSDLLFSASAVTRNYDKQVTVYPPGSFIYPYYGGYSYSIQVVHSANVTNTYDSTISLSLILRSTNLDLNQRTTPPTSGGGGTQSPTASAPPAMSAWLYTGVGVAGAAGVGAAVWMGTRTRKKNPSAVREPPISSTV